MRKVQIDFENNRSETTWNKKTFKSIYENNISSSWGIILSTVFTEIKYH